MRADGQNGRGLRAAIVPGLAALIVSAAAAARAQNVPAPVRDPRQPPAAQMPPRDRAPAPVTGTGVLSGRVVDAVTGRGVARARLRIQGGSRAPQSSTLSDDSGAFAFEKLPPGMYSVSADRSGYLPGRYPDPGRSLRNRSQMIQLADGQARDDITVAMFRGGVIAGRVVDAHGDPVEGANVSVLTAPRSGRAMMRNSTQTNDLGEFRAIRLAAGRYIVRVRPPNTYQMDPFGTDQPLPQPLPAYYPSALSLDGAQPIVVNRGETVTGVDVALGEGQPSIVSGMVLGVESQQLSQTMPGGGMNVNGSVQARVGGAFDGMMEAGTGIRPDGSFRMQLPPGEYVLEAQVMPVRAGQQPRAESQLFGSTRIAVGGGPVENVTISLGGGATATGRVIFEGATPPPPSPGQARVPLFNAEGGPFGCRPPMATIDADWSFKVEGLVGTCAMQPGAMMGRWSVKAVTFRDKDLAQDTITFESGQHYSNVQIVVTDRRTQVDVRVADEGGQPTTDYVALVFPADKSKWSQIGRYMRTVVPPVTSRTSAAVPPGTSVTMQSGIVQGGAVQGTMTVQGGIVTQSGSFSASLPIAGAPRVGGLQPGDYFAIALDDIDPEDMQDPDVLEKLSASAVRFTVSFDAPIEVPVRRWKLADIIR